MWFHLYHFVSFRIFWSYAFREKYFVIFYFWQSACFFFSCVFVRTPPPSPPPPWWRNKWTTPWPRAWRSLPRPWPCDVWPWPYWPCMALWPQALALALALWPLALALALWPLALLTSLTVSHSHFVSLYYIHAVHARCVRTFLLLYCLQLCLSEPISLKLQWSYFTVRIHFYCLIT